ARSAQHGRRITRMCAQYLGGGRCAEGARQHASNDEDANPARLTKDFPQNKAPRMSGHYTRSGTPTALSLSWRLLPPGLWRRRHKGKVVYTQLPCAQTGLKPNIRAKRRGSMVADLSARERLRVVAESAKRIRTLVSVGDESFAIELTRIA